MAESRKIKLTLAYDGTRYHGWQFQKNGLTIQEVLEDKLRVLTQEPVRVFASGRTDAGVHALGQVCHLETRSLLRPEELERGLNGLLPDDIHIVRAEGVPPGFHARYDARSKVYEYRILNRPEPDVFLRRTTWHVSRPLDLEAVEQGLARIRGEHDFSSFRSAGSGNRNPVRRVLRAELLEHEPGRVSLVFEANGFLRHMVRNLVGTLVDVGTGKVSPADFEEILEAGDRGRAGVKAPAQGLFLMEVRYGDV
jgi:tRNA pseudouridine38-40 synthase